MLKRAVARRFFDTYDRDRNGYIDNVVGIVDIYIYHQSNFLTLDGILIQFKIIAIFLQNVKQKLRRQNHLSETQRFLHQISMIDHQKVYMLSFKLLVIHPWSRKVIIWLCWCCQFSNIQSIILKQYHIKDHHQNISLKLLYSYSNYQNFQMLPLNIFIYFIF
ncbi:unnamed protein product [Paramecium sonneborni]|uniref:Uncharacterized protein n=1 Tax=Paramecium sonneborni TaxID=65129 RepID=A0A8S1RQY4_9CILI|nr:unnamed protein product [Paramecium sonneborni]